MRKSLFFVFFVAVFGGNSIIHGSYFGHLDLYAPTPIGRMMDDEQSDVLFEPLPSQSPKCDYGRPSPETYSRMVARAVQPIDRSELCTKEGAARRSIASQEKEILFQKILWFDALNRRNKGYRQSKQVEESFGRKDIEALEHYEFLHLIQRVRAKRDEIVVREQQQRQLALIKSLQAQVDPEVSRLLKRAVRPPVFRDFGDMLPTK